MAEALEVPSEVLPYLFLGSYGAVEHSERLRSIGITHLLSLVGSIPADRGAYTSLRLEVSDSGESDLSQVLRQVAPFVDQARRTDGKVLIFCALGVNRSPAVVASYLRCVLGWSLPAALAHLAQVRPAVDIHQRYLAQLRSL